MTDTSLDPRVVLVVRHGRERGRHPRYMQALLDDLARRHPAVGKTLAIHETGAPAPTLDGVRAVVFLLADPLREHFPACFAEASAIAADARSRGLHLVNPPEALSNTVKSTQSRIWQENGIPTPVQLLVETHADVASAAQGLVYPMILRPDNEHAQHGLRVCGTREELETAAATLAFPGVVAPLVDSRAGFVPLSPGTPFARYHHKKRALVLGDRVVPNGSSSRDPRSSRRRPAHSASTRAVARFRPPSLGLFRGIAAVSERTLRSQTTVECPRRSCAARSTSSVSSSPPSTTQTSRTAIRSSGRRIRTSSCHRSRQCSCPATAYASSLRRGGRRIRRVFLTPLGRARPSHSGVGDLQR